jgi:hypothetical protein
LNRHWSKALSYPLVLKNGERLETLADCGGLLTERFSGVLHHEALEYAIVLLMRAAESGKVADRREATDQVERVLRGRGLI